MSVSWQERVETMVTEAAASWFTRATALAHEGRFPAFHLYYRESTDTEFGNLDLVPEDVQPGRQPALRRAPSCAGWKLADAEPYRPSLTRDQVRARVRGVAWNLPILPRAQRGLL